MSEDLKNIVINDEMVVKENEISSLDFDIENEVKKTTDFEFKEDFYHYFNENKIDITTAVEVLIKTNTLCSMYVLVQIFGDKTFVQDFDWEDASEAHIKSFGKLCKKYNYFGALYSLLYTANREGFLRLKGIKNIPIKDLSFMDFNQEMISLIQRLKNAPKRKKKKTKTKYKTIYGNCGNSYDKYEHGISDW